MTHELLQTILTALDNKDKRAIASLIRSLDSKAVLELIIYTAKEVDSQEIEESKKDPLLLILILASELHSADQFIVAEVLKMKDLFNKHQESCIRLTNALSQDEQWHSIFFGEKSKNVEIITSLVQTNLNPKLKTLFHQIKDMDPTKSEVIAKHFTHGLCFGFSVNLLLASIISQCSTSDKANSLDWFKNNLGILSSTSIEGMDKLNNDTKTKLTIMMQLLLQAQMGIAPLGINQDVTKVMNVMAPLGLEFKASKSFIFGKAITFYDLLLKMQPGDLLYVLMYGHAIATFATKNQSGETIINYYDSNRYIGIGKATDMCSELFNYLFANQVIYVQYITELKHTPTAAVLEHQLDDLNTMHPSCAVSCLHLSRHTEFDSALLYSTNLRFDISKLDIQEKVYIYDTLYSAFLRKDKTVIDFILTRILTTEGSLVEAIDYGMFNNKLEIAKKLIPKLTEESNIRFLMSICTTDSISQEIRTLLEIKQQSISYPATPIPKTAVYHSSEHAPSGEQPLIGNDELQQAT